MGHGTTLLRPRAGASAEPGFAGAAPAVPERPPADASARFRDLVRAAVDFVHEGHVAQAALLLGLAERWQAEQALAPECVRQIRDRLSETLDEEQLVRSARDAEGREPVAAVLEFFPRFSRERLFHALRHESRGDRRLALLTLLTAQGRPARDLAIEKLKSPVGDVSAPDEWYLRRNLLHLLRRIPAPPDSSATESLDIAVRHSRIGLPAPVVKEAVALLGQTQDDRAEFVLMRSLGEVADMLPVREAYGDTNGLSQVAERICAALAFFPTARARRAIVDHAERLRRMGRPMAALAALGRQDLSADEAIVDRLLALVRRIRRSHLAGRLVPFLRDRDDGDLVPVMEALAGTPLPVVRRALGIVARRFPNQKSGRAAAAILADLDRKSAGA